MPLTPEQKTKRIAQGIPVPSDEDVKDFILAAATNHIDMMQSYFNTFGTECADEVYGVATALMTAVQFGQMESLCYLIEMGANVNRGDQHGVTPAMTCAYKDNDEMLDVLLKNGAKLESKSEQGMTPLIFAAWHNAPHCVALLLQSGANMNAVDIEGLDATDRALCNNNYDIVSQLEEHRRKSIREAYQQKLQSIKDAFTKSHDVKKKTKPVVRKKKPPSA